MFSWSKHTQNRPESRNGKFLFHRLWVKLVFLSLVFAGGWCRRDGHLGIIRMPQTGFPGPHTELEILSGGVFRVYTCSKKRKEAGFGRGRRRSVMWSHQKPQPTFWGWSDPSEWSGLRVRCPPSEQSQGQMFPGRWCELGQVPWLAEPLSTGC